MNKITKMVLVCLALVAVVAPAFAHHSAAAFNTQQQTKVTGTVKEYRFRNPHVYLILEVKNAAGATVAMEVEAGAASVLGPLGFTKDSVAVGDVVTIAGNPGRSKPDTLMLGRDLFKGDGTYYPLNISSKSVYTNKGATATSIAGTWFSTGFGAVLGAIGKAQVTEQGTAARKQSDPKATTQKDCIPIGAPALMFYPVATTVTVQKDRVIFDVDWMDSVRTVYLDGRRHPPATETTYLGHSTGKWEGDTLVVETTNFKEHPMGLSTNLPSSAQKKLIERFKVAPDGKNLLYSGTVEDPVYLVKPVDWTGQWEYRPGMQHSNEKCDVEVARKFLKDF